MTALTLSPPLQMLLELAVAWRDADRGSRAATQAEKDFRYRSSGLGAEGVRDALLAIDRLTRELAAESARLDWRVEHVVSCDRYGPAGSCQA
jgi:hypothetical protein